MKLKVFQSDKGDCLLLSSESNKGVFNMLVDGGMKESYTRHVSPTLGKMREDGQRLNLVYVSHIDQDHISGVLRLFEDMLDWRVFDFQQSTGGSKKKQPASIRPPEVDAIWHNAFHEQIGDNAGAVEHMLAASAAILSGSENAQTLVAAGEHQDLANSTAEAIQLSRRVGPKQLKIPLNPEFEQGLMCIKDGMPSPVKLGGLEIYVIGPFTKDLDALRNEWQTWLAKNQKRLENIQRKASEDEKSLLTTEAARLSDLAQAQADELHKALAPDGGADGLANATVGKRLGQRKKVTTPNLASLMLFVREDDRTVLLTGDGHAGDILKGLEHHNLLDQNGGQTIHVNVLKVQHHLSEHNIDEEFCRRVTARHYVFCGNGEHANPDIDALDALINSRLGGADALSPNKEVNERFTLWFNSSEKETQDEKAKKHMMSLRQRLQEWDARHPGRFEMNFLEDESFYTIEV